MEILERISAVTAHFLEQLFGAKGIEILLQILVFLVFGVLVWFIDPISMRFRFIRRFRRHEEKYCGNYIQIIQSGSERRYSLVNIFYDHKLRRYVLIGKQYDAAGHPAIDFRSDRVLVVEEIEDTIEFSWRSAINFTKERYEGYTKMTMTDASDVDMLEGNGFFITFYSEPRRENFQFVKMSKARLSEFGLIWPGRGADNTAFIISFHNTLQLHPELEPVEDSKRPYII